MHYAPPSLPPFALRCIFALKVRCEGQEMRVSVRGMFFLLSKNHAIIPNEDYIIKLVRTKCSQQTNRFTES